MNSDESIDWSQADWSRENPRRFWDPSRRLLKSIRTYQRLKNNQIMLLNLRLKICVISYRFWSVVTGAEIDLNCNIGGGLLIPHPNGIVIHPEAQIGVNCLIFQQVTLAGPVKIGYHVDIGAGAGFPSLPLKLIFPNLKVILLEVNKKKQKFLSILIKILNLKDVQICDLDWRTFLRTTTEDVDLFVTRAALNELELCRLFKPACHYKHSLIVYWASEQWEPHERAEKFVREFKPYRLGHKKRKLVFMSLNESER